MNLLVLPLMLLLGEALAERPFLNEPDTGLILDAIPLGTLPSLADMFSAPDFEAAARHYMPIRNYSYYRTGSAGEFSYRRSLEIYAEVGLRPRILRNMSKVSLTQTVLGHTFSVPFFIAPAANAGFSHPRGELNLVEAAGKAGILYAPALISTKRMEDIAAHAVPGQVVFHQLYVSANKTQLLSDLRRIEKSGYKAIFVTVDFPVRGIHPREARYGFSNASYQDPAFNWDSYAELRKLTKLPVIPKGIQTVEDARLAVAAGAPGIYISNHGGRQLDTSQLPLETVLEIYKYAPEVFEQTEVFADGGVRYGTDVLKMMAMGVKMVGMGRPFMFANVFGVDGVTALIEIMRRELLVDAAILGVKDVRRVNTSYLNLRRLERYIVEL